MLLVPKRPHNEFRIAVQGPVPPSRITPATIFSILRLVSSGSIYSKSMKIYIKNEGLPPVENCLDAPPSPHLQQTCIKPQAETSDSSWHFCLNRGFKGSHRLHGKLYTVRKNKIVHIFIDNQWFNTEKLYSSCTGVQFGLTPALSRGEGGIDHMVLKTLHFSEK